MHACNRLGPLPSYEYEDKEDQLHEWAVNNYCGVMGLSGGPPPEECIQFCYSQYERFKIPAPAAIEEIVHTGALAAIQCIDSFDPYVLFAGASDVDITDDWSKYTYEILDGDRVYEVDPTSIETFSFIPNQDEVVFNRIMSHPGLDALPVGIGSLIRDVLDGEMTGEDKYACLTHPAKVALENLCITQDGRYDTDKMDAYFELAAWSAFAWLAGPLGRQTRIDQHEIFAVAVNYGEAIIIDGSVISPKNYRKLSRPPRSCMKCGLAAWCVEMISAGGTTRYMCEHCLSEGMAPSPMTTCGSKRCLLSECTYHPYHHLGSPGIYQARRDFGQLGASARGESVLRIKG
jgi:hypothetical protein